MAVAQRIYANALFEAAREQNRLEPVREELREFADAVEQVPELHALLSNPQLDPRARAHALRVELTTAIELSEDDARRILEQIERVSGRRLRAARSVDPTLIGGFVLRAGSHRVDASVRGRLEQLRRQLTGRS